MRQVDDPMTATPNQVVLLDLALEAGAMGTWHYDAAKKLLHLDATELKLFGLDPENFGGTLEEALNRIHDHDRHRVEVALRNAIASGGTFNQEFRVSRPDGGIRWLSGLGRPGAADSFVGVTSDKSAQPSAVMALAESERRLRLASQAAKLGAFEYDAASQTLILDQQAQAVFHCTSSVLSLDDWLNLMHPTDREVMHEFAARALDPLHSQEEGRAEYRMLLPSGEIVWVEGRYIVLFAGQGAHRRARRAVGTVQDITDRKTRELELESLTRILDTLFETAPIGLALWDEELRYMRINTTLARINGMAMEDHIGRRIDEMLPELAIEAFMERHRRVIETGEPSLNMEVAGETPAEPGVLRYWNESIIPIHVDGRLIGIAGFVDETTVEKRYESQRELLVRELNHRVKNTLMLVQSLANSSLRQAASPSSFVDAFSGRLAALARAHDMVVEANWQQIDLASLIKTQAMVDSTMDGDRIFLEGPPVTLDHSDGVMFGLAIHELVTNAQKYGALSAPDGRVAVSWDVSETGRNSEILLTWHESGGPTINPPVDNEGFGFKMVRTAIGNSDSGGKAPFEFNPAGLRCVIRFPVNPA